MASITENGLQISVISIENGRELVVNFIFYLNVSAGGLRFFFGGYNWSS